MLPRRNWFRRISDISCNIYKFLLIINEARYIISRMEEKCGAIEEEL
jgi:hypothetical protein